MGTLDFSDLRVTLVLDELMEDLRFGRERDDEEDDSVLERARALLRESRSSSDLTFR